MKPDFLPKISVGIYTSGEPIISEDGEGLIRLDNMLIGKDFHWQRTISVLLPGEVFPITGESRSENGITLINRLPLETYLECVVGSEMNPDAPLEFLKAHAVISRSWALGKIIGSHPENDEGRMETADSLIGWDDTSSHSGFDVCSDDHCQRYQGIQPVSPQALKAIRSTTGEVIMDNDGTLVDARFSKCCGGRSEKFSTCWQDYEVKGLVSIEDPWCHPDKITPVVLKAVLKNYDLSEASPLAWSVVITKEEIARNLNRKFGRDIGRIKRIEPIKRGESGRICLLRIIGSEGNLTLGKELWIRRLLSPTHLYSSWFDIEDNGDYIRLTGRGWGHGVGLCQIGAARMAIEGADYHRILSFYYPDTHCYTLPLLNIEH